jgi:hypothetical protein
MWCHGRDVPVVGVVEDIDNSNPDLYEDVFVVVPCTSGVI